MYIKTLTIQGFKTYRDQTAIEPFSPGHNVVVGRNGSGKSNFFAAIRFVLSDAYTSMSREERQSLLHEGTSVAATLSAYVEIVFDNSDGRFPTGKDELILRRTIGLKKDEYTLDKKSTSKADVMNLLESAGFSKSNPYYIVPQGRITSLTTAKDAERLALLKEVAGTRVYEQRRTESLRIMDETNAKSAKIEDLLTYIEERLDELEEEKKELKEFQEKDKDRRCLEYALYQRELDEIADALTELENDRNNEAKTSEERLKGYNQRESAIERLTAKIADTRQRLSLITLSKHGYSSEMNELVRARTEIECIVSDLQQAGEQGQEKKEGLEQELEEVVARINDLETQLMEIVPDWQDKVKEEKEEKRRLDDETARLQALYSKQGRIAQFTTVAARDKFLNDEIKKLKSLENTQAKNAQELDAELDAARTRLQALGNKSADVRQSLDDRKERLKELVDNLATLKDEQLQLSERRKELWREDTKLESTVGHARDELRVAERSLASMMDKDTGSGLRAVRKISERLQLGGVYGPLYELFEIPDDFRDYSIAVEVTAGTSLFHVVVDNDETATKLLDVMIKEKTGRVTFMPLNRLNPRPVQFPNAPNVEPLITKLRYDAGHAKAFEQVFGKTCVCKDLHVAAAYVRSHNLNTITTDGDKVDRKGALTGGFHDVRRSRIEAIKNVKSWSEKYEAESKRLAEVKSEIIRIDQEITRVLGRVQLLSTQKNLLLTSREPLANQYAELQREQDTLGEKIARLEAAQAEQEADLSGMKGRRAGYEKEIGTPIVSNLSSAEMRELESLAKEVDQRKTVLLELTKSKSDLGSQKSRLEIELNESLRRRREELRDKIDSIGEVDTGDDNAADDLNARTRELASLTTSIDAMKKKVRELEKESDTLNTKLQEYAKQLETIQTQQAEDSRGISRQQKNAERYIAKKQMLASRKDECSKSIRDLGVLPEEAYGKYTKVKLDRLVKQLHVVNESLKKFGHVNKKAFEQYSNFTKQRDQLRERREDLTTSAESITELVEVLDQRKDEAIERTFKQVSQYFSEVFEKLVPAGRGRLIIQKRLDQPDPDDVDEDDQAPQNETENYTGVSIKVSFNSKVDEGLRIQQLSGGQKALVALATVFAIQKCDPAPFYLFDEIDANLDPQFRTAVASMIHELSSSAQFITTTFRPEMLAQAEQFYGVLFGEHKVSSIRVITREEAREFVDSETAVQ